MSNPNEMVDLKPNEYRCDLCCGVFVKAWSDAEAEAELHARFPGNETVACSMVCHDCYLAALKDLADGHETAA